MAPARSARGKQWRVRVPLNVLYGTFSVVAAAARGSLSRWINELHAIAPRSEPRSEPQRQAPRSWAPHSGSRPSKTATKPGIRFGG